MTSQIPFPFIAHQLAGGKFGQDRHRDLTIYWTAAVPARHQSTCPTGVSVLSTGGGGKSTLLQPSIV
jgi:hypothetical protein